MNNYMFTYIRRNNREVPIVRVETSTDDETIFKTGKHYSIAITQSDIIYSYEFVIKMLFKTEIIGERCYRWYQLDYFSKSVDRSPEVKSEADQNAANIDYLAMMSGIDIPIEEESYDEQELSES